MSYGVVHTTNLSGCDCYSAINETTDIENGSLVVLGDLKDGERDIYLCDAPTAAQLAATPVHLVAHPAWKYEDHSVTCQNEDEFINKKGKPFRTYELKPFKRYRVSVDMLEGTPAKNHYIGLKAGSFKALVSEKAPAGSAFVAQIIALDSVGFDHAVGSGGKVSGDSGGVVVNKHQFAVIKIVKNG